jgi:7-carboxy-7-deazaguanine synthase
VTVRRAGPQAEGSAVIGEAGDAARIFLTEIFSAIQGEAALVGERQVFVRLAGCNIRCGYCDQPDALERRPGPCRVEQTPGRRDFRTVASPLETLAAAEAVERLCTSLPHHSVSITGGEPLFQARRLEGLLAELTRRGRRVYLETNGMLVPGLRRVAHYVEFVSMDVKLPSVDGERVDPALQRSFLREAVARCPQVFTKIVISAHTAASELDAALEMIHAEAPGSDVFLQPVTPFGIVLDPPSPSQVLDLQARALRLHPHVRVVPQTHKSIGQL